jgi:hypothetical protein
MPKLTHLLDMADRSSILNTNPDGKVVSVDIECDVDILRMKVRPRRIMEPGHLAAGQD